MTNADAVLTERERASLAALCNAFHPSLTAGPGDDPLLFSTSASDLGRQTRTWREEDRSRVLFEAVAYGSALLLESELATTLTRRKLLFGKKPDHERMGAFRASFLRHLREKLRSENLARVEVPPEGRVGAHGVTGLERLMEYTHRTHGAKAYEYFGVCMGRALDPDLQVITNIVALESIPMLVKVVRGALEGAVGKTAR